MTSKPATKQVTLKEIYKVITAVRSDVTDWFGLLYISNLRAEAIDAALLAGAVIERAGIFSIPKRQEPIEPTAAEKLDAQIELKHSDDRAIAAHGEMVEQCSKPDWLSQLVEEIEASNQTTVTSWPVFAGCKLRNGDRARKDQYCIYTGNQSDINAACAELAELGIDSIPSHNGSQGSWKLLIPFNQQLDFFMQEVA